jgi:hypothetical protein
LRSPNFYDGGRFWVWIVVAPSHSPKQLDPLEFTENASEVARLVFGEQQFRIDYSGSELCRYIVPNPAHPTSLAAATHVLSIYPAGCVVLQWGLKTSQLLDSRDVELSLDEIVAVLDNMYWVAHDPRFPAIHARRRTEKLRRLDWRVGLTSSISVIDHGPVYWRSLSSSTKLPAVVPTGQNPSCPVQGFAVGKMTSIKQNATMAETFTPAIEHLLVDAGYSGGVRQSVRAALDRIGTHPNELAADTPHRGARRVRA